MPDGAAAQPPLVIDAMNLFSQEKLQELGERYLTMALDWIVLHGLNILLIVFLAFLFSKSLKAISRTLFTRIAQESDDEYKKRVQTLESIVLFTITVVVVSITSFVVLTEAGVDIAPILAAAGVIGLAVGFGAQTLVQDVISGFFLLVEDQLRVGDVVKVGGHSGVVERVTLRMTILRDLEGNVHFLRNGLIDTVINMTKDYSRIVLDIGVAYRENVDEVMRVVTELSEELRQDPDWARDIVEPMEMLGLDEFADSAVIIRARLTTRPMRQWAVKREFNRRLKNRFDELGIEIPFPHITLYAGVDKEGGAPSLPVALNQGKGADAATPPPAQEPAKTDSTDDTSLPAPEEN